jgi:glutamate dehydrogenase
MRELWREIEALDNKVPAAVQYDMDFATSRALRHATFWILANRTRALEVEPAVAELGPGLNELINAAPRLVVGRLAARIESDRARYHAAGVPAALAARVAGLALLQSGLYIVDLAARRRRPLHAVARTYLHLGHTLELDGLQQQIDALPADGHWQSIARGTLRDNLYGTHRTLVDMILKSKLRADPVQAVDAWLATRPGPVAHLKEVFVDMAAAPSVDFPTLSVALQALVRLADD